MLLNKIRINQAYPFVGRAAGRSVAGTLNFIIANLCAADIRAKTAGVPVEPVDLDPLLKKYGNTLDQRNEQDEASRGAAHEELMRQEQGHALAVPPLEMAGKLKVIRDAIAEDLEMHATLLKNPLDPQGGTYYNPFDVAPSLESSFRRQLAQAPRLNPRHVEAMLEAIAIGGGVTTVTKEDIERVMRTQQEAGLRFLKEHGDEILGFIATLEARDSANNVLGTDDAEQVEQSLPPIRRAALYVAADRGLWYERDRCIQLIMRRHPNGAGNMELVDNARKDIHAEFGKLMKDDAFQRGIDEAVQRGSNWPVLLALPQPRVAVAVAA